MPAATGLGTLIISISAVNLPRLPKACLNDTRVSMLTYYYSPSIYINTGFWVPNDNLKVQLLVSVDSASPLSSQSLLYVQYLLVFFIFVHQSFH